MPGAWPFVHAVFQKMLENPRAIGPLTGSGRTRAGGIISTTVPPQASVGKKTTSVVFEYSGVASRVVPLAL